MRGFSARLALQQLRTYQGHSFAYTAVQSSGLLPPFVGIDATTADRSPYRATIGEFCLHFGTTPYRKNLLRNLIAYRRLLGAEGYTDGYQFLDGNFVEDLERVQNRLPGDIDVFSLLSAPTRYLNDPAAWQSAGLPFWQNEIVDRDKNKRRFSLDTFALLLQEATLPTLIETVMYWSSLFSHQRNTFAWKGFAAVPLDAQGDAIALNALGSV